MQLTATCVGKFFLRIFLSAALVITGNACLSQNVTLSLKQAPLEEAIRELEKRTPLRFVYTREQLKASLPVTIDAAGEPLAAVLNRVFSQQHLIYEIDDKYIVLRSRPKVEGQRSLVDVGGIVRGEAGTGLEGVSVGVKGSRFVGTTDAQGEFALRGLNPEATLVFSSVGYESLEIPLRGRHYLSITLPVAVMALDETVVRAYGTTTRRLNTGNITRIPAEDIEKQPVSNPLAALAGRVPGMVVTQTSGVPGAAFKMEIRGRTSLDFSLSRNDPLIIVDGVPFEPGNGIASLLTSAANVPNQISQGGLSPMSSINPSDIESIEVLKDADATAIYGSRGASGVVLITTKRGKPGKLRVGASMYAGWSEVTRTMPMMHTQTYVAMRKEAFANDGLAATTLNAPDIMVWDTTRYTDYRKLLVGGRAHQQQVHTTLSGGTELTRYSLGSTYRRETTVYPGDYGHGIASMLFKLHQASANRRFRLDLSTSYAHDVNRLIAADLAQYIRQVPNLRLYNPDGKLNWEEGGVNFALVNNQTNPLAVLEKKYRYTGENLISSLQLAYDLGLGVHLKLSSGYNVFRTDETSINPKRSLNPIYGSAVLASAGFARSSSKSWILEPQLSFETTKGQGRMQLLAGGSMQSRQQERNQITATNYTDDLLLYSMAAAGLLRATNSFNDYRYIAAFGRLNYTYASQYLLNLSGRRDGSSRFGPGNRFSNFGALGAGWIFTEATGIRNKLPLLSFGKLRFSYGITGNDQIGEYNYLDLWNTSTLTYQGVPAILPTRLFNPDYSWERTRKFEAGIETTWWKNRISFNASYYRHRSSNQLISYRLPSQTGFSSVTQNFPALVENSGLEVDLRWQVSASGLLRWQSAINLSVPRNRLISFPGLESSSYNNLYVVGSSLSVINRYRYLGVDPSTGVYHFEDLNKDGQLRADDYQVLGNRDPQLYGGWQHNLSYGAWALSAFVQVVKQKGLNYLSIAYSFPPGTAVNQPSFTGNRWQKPGDQTPYPRYTQSASSDVAKSSMLLNLSDGIYSDASFIRLKNVQLNYDLQALLKRQQVIHAARMFLTLQNIATLTDFPGSDPETQNFYQLPPLKTIMAGIQIEF